MPSGSYSTIDEARMLHTLVQVPPEIKVGSRATRLQSSMAIDKVVIAGCVNATRIRGAPTGNGQAVRTILLTAIYVDRALVKHAMLISATEGPSRSRASLKMSIECGS